MIQDHYLAEFLYHFHCFHIINSADQPSDDGRKRLFEKRMSAEEMRKKTNEYQTFVLKDIFPEYKLKEYIDGIKDILQKNGDNEEVGDVFTGDGNSWFSEGKL